MTDYSPNPDINREARRFQIEQQLMRLIRTPGQEIDPNRLAHILGLEQFYTETTSTSTKHGAVRSIKIKDWVDYLVQNKVRLPEETFEYHNDDIFIIGQNEQVDRMENTKTETESRPLHLRTQYLMEVLEDLNLPYKLGAVEGNETINTKNIQSLDYKIFIIPSLDKIIFVSNEEANATLIIHNALTDNHNIYKGKTRAELKAFGNDVVTEVRFNHHLDQAPRTDDNHFNSELKWKQEIKSALTTVQQPKIKREQSVAKEIPSGFLSTSGMEKKFQIHEVPMSRAMIKKIVDGMNLTADKDYFIYRSSNEVEQFFYAPHIIDTVEQEVIKRKKSGNWLSVNQIEASIKAASGPEDVASTRHVIKDIVEKFGLIYGLDYEPRITESGRESTFYSPYVVELFEKELKKRSERPPEGWLRNTEIVKKFAEEYVGRIKLSRDNLAKFLKDMNLVEGKDFGRYIGFQNRLETFYSKETIEKIKDYLR